MKGLGPKDSEHIPGGRGGGGVWVWVSENTFKKRIPEYVQRVCTAVLVLSASDGLDGMWNLQLQFHFVISWSLVIYISFKSSHQVNANMTQHAAVS